MTFFSWALHGPGKESAETWKGEVCTTIHLCAMSAKRTWVGHFLSGLVPFSFAIVGFAEVKVCPAKHAPANHMSPVNVKITSTWHTVGSMCMQRSVTCWNEKMPAWRQSRLRNVWCHVSEIIPKLRVVFANFRHWRPRSIARSKIYTVPGPLKITLLALLGHPHHRSKWEHIRPNLHKLLSLRPHKFLHIGHLQAKTSQQ